MKNFLIRIAKCSDEAGCAVLFTLKFFRESSLGKGEKRKRKNNEKKKRKNECTVNLRSCAF